MIDVIIVNYSIVIPNHAIYSLHVGFEELDCSSTELLVSGSKRSLPLLSVFLLLIVELLGALETLMFEVLHNIAVFPTEGSCKGAERCDWAIVVDRNHAKSVRDNLLRSLLILGWNTLKNLQTSESGATASRLVVAQSANGLAEHLAWSTLVEWTITRVGIRGLVQVAAVLVIVESVITVCDDVLAADDNDLLAFKELLRDSCSELALNVALAVNHDSGH